MSMQDSDFSVQSPDPAIVTIIGGLFRTILAALSGAGVLWASAVNDQQISLIASAVVLIGTAVWSAYAKIRDIRKRRNAAIASAVASANATTSLGQTTAIAITEPTRTPLTQPAP